MAFRKLSLSESDKEMLSAEAQTREHIFKVFGVPPIQIMPIYELHRMKTERWWNQVGRKRLEKVMADEA